MADPTIKELAAAASAKYADADIFAYFGGIKRPWDDEVLTQLGKRKLRTNVILILTTLTSLALT